MMNKEKWILTGAWAVMAVVGALSLYKVSQAPAIDPAITRLAQDLAVLEHGKTQTTPPSGKFPMPDHRLLDRTGLGFIDPGADLFRTKAIGHPVEPPVLPAQVLSFPVLGSVKTELDGVTLVWFQESRKARLHEFTERAGAQASGFTVLRQVGDGEILPIAELGPEAKSYTDLSVKPRQTYHYWVSLTGLETDRTVYAGKLLPVTNRTDTPVKAVLPSDVRVKLIGGGPNHAVLRVETYDRDKKYWVPKTVLANPGEPIDGTGWSLNSLTMNTFTLAAEATDDAGVVRKLTTRN